MGLKRRSLFTLLGVVAGCVPPYRPAWPQPESLVTIAELDEEALRPAGYPFHEATGS
jgi:hypothetical protein